MSESEYRFLSDGRKVEIIERLNTKEIIVQEVYIDEHGKEITSGPKFVATNLYETKPLTWNEKRLKNVEEALQKEIKKLEDIKEECKNIKNELQARRAILKNVDLFVKHLPKAQFDTFIAFLSGTVEYIVTYQYKITKPIKFIDGLIRWETFNGKEYDNIKLMSVLGKSNGEIAYGLHQYYDSSGLYEQVHPFTCYEDAVAFIKTLAQNKIEQNKLSTEEYNTCMELGIQFDQRHIYMFKDSLQANLDSALQLREQRLKDSDESILKLKDFLTTV